MRPLHRLGTDLWTALQGRTADRVLLLSGLLTTGLATISLKIMLQNRVIRPIIACRSDDCRAQLRGQVDQMVLDFPCMRLDYSCLAFLSIWQKTSFNLDISPWPRVLTTLTDGQASENSAFLYGRTHKKSTRCCHPGVVVFNPGSV